MELGSIPMTDQSRSPDSPSRADSGIATRFLWSLIRFGPLVVAILIVGDFSLGGIAVSIGIAAIGLVLVLVWDKRTTEANTEREG
jgi:hypothetical protein